MSVKSKKVTEFEFDLSVSEDPLLWPEWSDVTLNKENWANPKNGSDGLFLDTRPVQLPLSLQSSEWIRANNLKNVTEPLTVFVTSSEYPDLITNNQHILHSEFARWVISALINLQYCGRDGLEISGENGNFIWNGRYQSWRGWMHVYSMNKAGKGAQHRPTINPNGKYIVRLYFLGSWRRIVVDNTIPVNQNGLPVLPRTANDHELWPILLSKALLKLCSMTWSGDREIVDFHPVTCLTGWVCLRLEIGYLSPQDKWDFLRKYADHFDWEAEATEQEFLDSKKSSEGKKSKGTSRSKKSKDTKESKKSKDTDRSKKSKGGQQKPIMLKKPEPVTLFLGLDDMKTLPSEKVPGLSPCWSHFVYVAQSRDVPLDPKDVKPPLARWKLYRWLKWAIQQGIIDPVEYFVPIRSLKIVSPLKTFEESIINKYTEQIPEEHDQKNVPDSKATSEKSEKKSKHRDRSKESKSPKAKGSSKKLPEETPLPDISFWADFNKMEPHVKDVHFFYKLDYFQYTAKISDRFTGKQPGEQKIGSKKGSKQGSRVNSPVRTTFTEGFIDVHCWPEKISSSRNEPLYIFTDSVEEKFFFINFSTFQATVDPLAATSELDKGTSRTVHDSTGQSNDFQTVASSMPPVVNKDYLIIERHSWFHRQKHESNLVHLLTAGTKATVMEMESGRHLLRMYCGSECHCFMTISSDTIFHLGDRRKMYRLMSTESDTIDQKVKHISNCVSNAYQSFGTDRYPETLKSYYKSYLPPAWCLKKRTKVFYNQIHTSFLSEKVRLIKKILPQDQVTGIVRSLRIFFLNPRIGFERYNPFTEALLSIRGTTANAKIERQHSFEENILDRDIAASIIQSVFNWFLIKKYKMIHNPRHREHQEVLKNLLKVVELFNYNKRESLASQLFRYILKHFDILRDIYPCSKDFEYTIQVQELTGTLPMIKPNQWLPITRFMVNTQATEAAFARFDLFIDLPRYGIRVFNNETGKEMLRLVNNVAPTRYENVKQGYTIFAYGWNEDQPMKDVTWTMFIITKKWQPIFYSMNEEISPSTMLVAPPLVTEELSNLYIPNNKTTISKWIVRVNKPCLVSFRLRTSHDKVKIKLVVTNTDGDVLSKIVGTSVVILPFAYLGLNAESSVTHFKLESNTESSHVDGSTSSGKVLNGGDNDTVEDSIEGRIEVSGSRTSEESAGHRTYYVEAFVLDDSWPLTTSEWTVVTEHKGKPAGSTIRMKPSGSRLSKMEVSKTRKASRQFSETSQTLEKPHWVLQVVSNFGNGLEIAEDTSKERKIAELKETWAKEKPDSLARGRELRENFLKKHEIKPEPSAIDVQKKSTVTGRTSIKRECCVEVPASQIEVRTLVLPQTLRRLPPLDLSVYVVKEEEEDSAWAKTQADEEFLSNARVMNILYAQEDYNYFVEEMIGLSRRRKERYRFLFEEHKESFWEKRMLVEDVYEDRKNYIATMKPESGRGSKKSAKTKTTKTKSTKTKKT